MIALPNREAVKLINGDTVTLTQAKVLEPSAISQWRSSQALAQQTPQMSFSYCANLSTLPTEPFWAFTCVQPVQDLRSFTKGLEALAGSISAPIEDRLKLTKGINQQRLAATALSIKPNQLRFDVQAIKAWQDDAAPTPKPGSATRSITTHPIKLVIIRTRKPTRSPSRCLMATAAQRG